MRLTDLEPRWWAEEGRSGQGVSFLCPHCKAARLAIAFSNPLDGGPPVACSIEERLRWVHGAEYSDEVTYESLFDVPPCGPVWARAGDGFKSLTLTPSVDASAAGHWHGFITAGDVA